MLLDVSLKDRVVKINDAEIYVKPLDAVKFAEIRSKYMRKGKFIEEKEIEMTFDLLEEAITGWKNIATKDGEVKFSKEMIRPVLTALIQVDENIIEQIMNEATSLMNIKEEEVKK